MIQPTPGPKPALMRRRDLLTRMLGGAAAALASSNQARASDPATRRYVCTEPDCAPYVYNPAEGDPTQGIPPGTPFEDLPDDWICPRCQGPKANFIPLG